MILQRNSTGTPTAIDVIGAASIVAIGFGGYCMVVTPVLDRSAEVAAQQEHLAQLKSEHSESNSTRDSLQNELSEALKTVEQQSIRLVPARNSNQRLVNLTEVATNHALDLDKLQLGRVTAASPFDLVPIEIAGNGSFHECVAFIHELSQEFPDVGIYGMDLTDNPADPKSPTTFRFDLVWFAAQAVASAE